MKPFLAFLILIVLPAKAVAQEQTLANFLAKIHEAGNRGVMIGRAITVGDMIRSKDLRLAGGVLKFTETNGKINVVFDVQTVRPQAEYSATYTDCHPSNGNLECSAETGQQVTLKITRQTAADVAKFESPLPPLAMKCDKPNCGDALVLSDQQLQRLEMFSFY